MLITREVDYALRIISALSSGELCTASSICEQERAPLQFGYKILKKLAKGGLIEITRGKYGGCRLSCNLKETSLYDLIYIMGDKTIVTECMKNGYTCKRKAKNNNRCTIHINMARIQKIIDDQLKTTSLHSIVHED